MRRGKYVGRKKRNKGWAGAREVARAPVCARARARGEGGVVRAIVRPAHVQCGPGTHRSSVSDVAKGRDACKSALRPDIKTSKGEEAAGKGSCLWADGLAARRKDEPGRES